MSHEEEQKFKKHLKQERIRLRPHKTAEVLFLPESDIHTELPGEGKTAHVMDTTRQQNIKIKTFLKCKTCPFPSNSEPSQ